MNPQYQILPAKFFNQSSERVAQKLLGKYLIRNFADGGGDAKHPSGAPKGGEIGKKHLIGKIVETEAYHQEDPASHSYRGRRTARTAAMFGPPGFAYVYFTYGTVFCFNVVCEREHYGSAVLIRALEPVEGIEIMQTNRKQKNIHNLCSGPGKLCQAFGIDRKDYGKNLSKSDLLIAQSSCHEKFEIVTAYRIGISKAQKEPLRFYIKNNMFVSKK